MHHRRQTWLATCALVLCLVARAGAEILSTPAGDIAYEVRGVGCPLVLVGGGSAMDARQWESASDLLTDRFQTILVDPRGIGRSGNPEAPYADADDLVAVLDHLDLPSALFAGGSAAGGAVLEVALAHPERVIGAVAVAPFLAGFEPSPEMAARMQRFGAAVGSGGDAFVALVQGDPHFLPAPKRPEARETAWRLIRETFARPAADASLARVPDPSVLNHLSEIVPPLLLVAGELDHPDIFRRLDAIEAAVPGALRASVSAAGHTVAMENPRGFVDAILPFLRGLGCGDRPPPWDRLAQGAYDVGFKVEQRLDYSRPYRLDVQPSRDEHARPIRMFIWYPARHRASDRPLDYGDYLSANDLSAAPGTSSADRLRSLVEGLVTASPEPERFRQIAPRWLATRTRAARRAPVAEGRFPLLLVAPGGTTPAYLHAGLCEYLASHGYISVAVPSVPARAGERWPFDLTGIDLHLRDQEIALSHLFAWSSVDREKLGLLSWSVGGVSHALLQMRNPDVDAVVSLDGATAYAYGKELIGSSIYFAEQGLTVPYLQTTGLMPGRYEVEKDFSFYHALSTDARYLLRFEHLAHADFAAERLLMRSLTEPETSQPARESYATLARIVKGFLDAYVLNEPGAEVRFHQLVEDPSLRQILQAESSQGES